MVTKTPPFSKAVETDAFYKLIKENRADLFWRYHAKNKPNGDNFFSPDLKFLITALFEYEPSTRASMAELMMLPWFREGEVPSKEEIIEEFTMRR